jgi:amidase
MSLDTVKAPTVTQLGDIAAELGFTFTDADLAAHRDALLPAIGAYNLVDRLPDELPPVTYPRLPGRRPSPEENRHGAWYIKTEIKGAASGKLAGRRVALKDNICLAGVPMMNGASTLEGYVPEIDATVAARILDAGGTIAGKTVCEYFCFSGGSHTSASGPCSTRIATAIRPAARPPAAAPWSPPARCRWPWAAIRAARSASRPPFAASMG